MNQGGYKAVWKAGTMQVAEKKRNQAAATHRSQLAIQMKHAGLVKKKKNKKKKRKKYDIKPQPRIPKNYTSEFVRNMLESVSTYKKEEKEPVDKDPLGLRPEVAAKRAKLKLQRKEREGVSEQEIKYQLLLEDAGGPVIGELIKRFNEREYKPEFTPAGHFAYVQPQSFNVQPWNVFEQPTDRYMSFLWVGKRRTGKSFGLRCYLGTQRKRIKEVYVFTKSKVNKFYQAFLPDEFVYPGWYPGIAKKIIEYAASIMNKGERPDVHLVFDDLVSEAGIRNASEIADLYVLGRHNGCNVHFLTQKYNGLPPLIRVNCDYIIVYTLFNTKEKNTFIEENMSHMNRQTAAEVIDMYTDPDLHTSLVIELWRNTTDPNKYLKVYKAYDPKLKGPKKKGDKGDIGTLKYWQAGTQMISGGMGSGGPESVEMAAITDANTREAAMRMVHNWRDMPNRSGPSPAVVQEDIQTMGNVNVQFSRPLSMYSSLWRPPFS